MRRKTVYKKYYQPDIEHGSIALGRFINCVMKDGKKSTAEKVVYGALEKIKTESNGLRGRFKKDKKASALVLYRYF